MNLHLDCTLRDGGYYNDWDFAPGLVVDYLQAMAALQVDFVEIGFRSLKNEGFKGGCAFSTDSFLNSLLIPVELTDKIGVMINGSELASKQSPGLVVTLEKLFAPKSQSPVTLVRIACHVHEFETCLPAASWLKAQGYLVGFNLMQVADRSPEEITQLAKKASEYPIDALYFADSMGSLSPKEVTQIIQAFRAGWQGALGIHTHDNMGQAIANTLQAIQDGVTWVDSTVTGMGRGPGNAQTEYLTMALEPYRTNKGNPTKLFELIRKHFKPLQAQYGWGTNPYYYMAGQHGIHPTYIQEMLQDSRYSDEDILAVIDHLKIEGGKKFSLDTLEAARHFYSGEPRGTWSPKSVMQGRDVLIVGTGPGVAKYRSAIEAFIEQHQPYVIALNTQKNLREDLIHARAACHPVRLLADCHEHLNLPQPLITPASMLPEDVQQELKTKTLLDFGISVSSAGFEFHEYYAQLPTSLVVSYALAIATAGQANHIFMVGFDGYPAGDSRNQEMIDLFAQYRHAPSSVPLYTLTPSQYQLPSLSIYGALN
ncbi:aldolase catalytic domain-containing protein [Thiomicrospira cyclica]|uniref:Pyruvate carboxyltransferase n=1 Tax=Thiomicrospira cyclica (strain DSM 14477 / JCM 11371 / ALM1) TaxID=717773 RepID=F6DCV4_THICA|nr:aldolase catalytic domain-containing protein [Thiomicrospira cyclica]AEG31690.1 pyruvate carboxyltransferase [Thiomicrospira cyclica ALM1]